MKVGLDTSVVLRLLIGEPKRQAQRAWRAIVEARSVGGEAVVSDLVVSEAYFALQHHYSVPKAMALEQMRALFDSGDVRVAGCAGEVLTVPSLASAKPGFVDRLIHGGYVGGGIDRVLTFEKAAGKLPHARVLTE